METFSALLALCDGNSLVPGEFPAQRPVTQSFDVAFDLCLNKRLNKQSRRRWLETTSRSFWRHCNDRTLHMGRICCVRSEGTSLTIYRPQVQLKGWVNSSEAGDLRRHRAHYAFIVMIQQSIMHYQRGRVPKWLYPGEICMHSRLWDRLQTLRIIHSLQMHANY